jgi:hypothetical protein
VSEGEWSVMKTACENFCLGEMCNKDSIETLPASTAPTCTVCGACAFSEQINCEVMVVASTVQSGPAMVEAHTVPCCKACRARVMAAGGNLLDYTLTGPQSEGLLDNEHRQALLLVVRERDDTRLRQSLGAPRGRDAGGFKWQRQVCMTCCSVTPTQKCNMCHRVFYCGAECHKADWVQHRAVCHQTRRKPFSPRVSRGVA